LPIESTSSSRRGERITLGAFAECRCVPVMAVAGAVSAIRCLVPRAVVADESRADLVGQLVPHAVGPIDVAQSG
jgi:hypothetical protein